MSPPDATRAFFVCRRERMDYSNPNYSMIWSYPASNSLDGRQSCCSAVSWRELTKGKDCCCGRWYNFNCVLQRLKKLSLINTEIQKSNDGFTLGAPIWLGQFSSEQRIFMCRGRYLGCYLCLRFLLRVFLLCPFQIKGISSPQVRGISSTAWFSTLADVLVSSC